MSKPENALELSIPSDLSLYAYVRAFDRLLSARDAIPPSDATHNFYQLDVASQGLATAAIISATVGEVAIKLNLFYAPDEWSLQRIAINGGGDKSITEIWSPGDGLLTMKNFYEEDDGR